MHFDKWVSGSVNSRLQPAPIDRLGLFNRSTQRDKPIRDA